MTASRSRKEEKTYLKYRKTAPKSCQFCVIKKGDKQYVEETKNFKVIRNIFGYSLWDGQNVADHLMITPKEHVDSLHDISEHHAIEFMNLVGKYEKKHYNIYARAPSSKIKSVVHQHTHLIKPKGSSRKLVFLMRKPYIRLVK